jgi:TP901-1 family phage major tail protein
MPLSAAAIGNDFLLQVNTGTEAIPVWATVGSQRDTTVARSRDTIDVSSKDSRAKRVKAGQYSYEVSLEHLYVPGGPELDLLRGAIISGTLVMLREFRPIAADGAQTAGRVFTGVITGQEESWPNESEAVVSVTFTGDDFELAPA